MRFRGWIAIAATLTALGCAGSTPSGLAKSAYSADQQPYRAALYISPELADATAEVTTPGGERVVLPIGEMLDAELRRGTSRAFESFMIISGKIYTGPLEVAEGDSRELWPKTKDRREAPPEVIVACFPSEMRGHVLPAGDCKPCWGTISYRAGILYEVRTLDGQVISTGIVEGQGVERSQNGGEPLPLSTRLRDAVTQAVTALALQYRVALKNAEIDLPAAPGLIEEERLAETESEPDAG